MGEIDLHDWSKYAVEGIPWSESNQTFNDKCVQLDRVFHVTHVANAVNVLNERRILPRLIYDKCRLNTSRVLVVWLSPNDWTNTGGFRYGNVGFEYDWESIVADKKYYWVGVMPYSPLACRILITDQEHSELREYNPNSDIGPWKYFGGQHYFNGKYCLEFMYELALEVSSSTGLKLVNHHDKRCSIDPRNCPDLGLSDGRARGHFFAGIVSHSISNNVRSLMGKELQDYWFCLSRELGRDTNDISWRGCVERLSPESAALSRAICHAVFTRNNHDRNQLLGLFDSLETATDAIADCCGSLLGITSDDLQGPPPWY